MDAHTEAVGAELVADNYFSLLCVRPAPGPLFNSRDDLHEGQHPMPCSATLSGKPVSPPMPVYSAAPFDYPLTVIGVAQRGSDMGVLTGNEGDMWVTIEGRPRGPGEEPLGPASQPGDRGLFRRSRHAHHGRPELSSQERFRRPDDGDCECQFRRTGLRRPTSKLWAW